MILLSMGKEEAQLQETTMIMNIRTPIILKKTKTKKNQAIIIEPNAANMHH